MEIDDQYALAYLMKSEDKLNLKAIYAVRAGDSTESYGCLIR